MPSLLAFIYKSPTLSHVSLQLGCWIAWKSAADLGYHAAVKGWQKQQTALYQVVAATASSLFDADNMPFVLHTVAARASTVLDADDKLFKQCLGLQV